MHTRRASAAALFLVAAGLAVLTTASPASAETFKERWCADKPVPCVVSATRNGLPLTAADPQISIEMIGKQKTSDFNYTTFLVRSTSGELNLADTYSVTLDLGDLKPDYTESYASRPDVDRVDNGDGTYKLTFTGKPVLLTSGCNDSYPSKCPEKAKDQSYEFSAEIQQKKTNLEFIGFDRSQSVDSVNGIFLETPARGAPYLSSEWANSHFLTDGTTVVKGEARFRIPFSMLKEEFDVPDPATMTASSMVGSVNGKPASFEVSQDPNGGGVYIDISGVTFSRKVIKIRRGAITPTRTTVTKTKRTSPIRGKVSFDKATARGAKVTGYAVRCTSGRLVATSVGGKKAYRNPLLVGGLKPGKAYSCSVRALSKAGPGKWSKPRTLAGEV